MTRFELRDSRLVDRHGRELGKLTALTVDLSDSVQLVGGEDPEEPAVTHEAAPVVDLWHFYQSLFDPNKRQTLNPTRARIIKNALKVRSFDDCKRAIKGLRVSPWHNGENENETKYLDIRYALRGNSRSGESDEERIDRMGDLAILHAPNRPKVNDAKLKRLLEEVRYTCETGGERDRGKRAYAELGNLGYRVLRLEKAPWARLEIA